MTNESIQNGPSDLEQHQKGAQARLRANRDRIYSALKELGVTRVEIAYSGSGDSGQVDMITLYRGKDVVEPIGQVSVVSTASRFDLETSTWIERTQEETTSLEEALEDFVYDWSEFEHPGWENNDGASGDCTIDVAANEFNLDHVTYYTESESESHTL